MPAPCIPLQDCLTQIRHTQHLLSPASGQVTPSVQAFAPLLPPPASSLTLLAKQREQLLQQALQELARPAQGEEDGEARRVRQQLVEHLQQQLAQQRAQQAQQAHQRASRRARRAHQPAPAAAAPAQGVSAAGTEWAALLRDS